MNLLQNLLTNITEPLRTSTTYVAQPRFSGNIEEHYRLPIWIEDVENTKPDTHAGYIAYDAELSTDWQTPLEITPTARKLVDMVLSDDEWVVNTGEDVDTGTYEVVTASDACRAIAFETGIATNVALYRPHKQETSSPEEDRAFQALENALQAKKGSELGKIENLETIQEVLHALADGYEINDGHCDWKLSDFTDEIHLLSDITLPCTIKPKTVEQVLWLGIDEHDNVVCRKWLSKDKQPYQAHYYTLHKVPTMTRETEE